MGGDRKGKGPFIKPKYIKVSRIGGKTQQKRIRSIKRNGEEKLLSGRGGETSPTPYLVEMFNW